MNSDEFRNFSNSAIEYIIQYYENIRDRPVIPNVTPGFLKSQIPSSPPEDSEDWKNIMRDMDQIIMPGLPHWHSPRFHAYFTCTTSYPSIVGEILSAALGGVGFSWMSNPVATELEYIVMDWLATLLNLPEEFKNSHHGHGGGVIQGSASEATLICLLVAKDRVVQRMKEKDSTLTEAEILSKLVCYTSDQSNASVEKAGKLASVPMRLLPTKKGMMDPKILEDAIKEDIKMGFIPCYVLANWGTTNTCAFDPVPEIATVCKKYENIWIHIDAAYAGAMLICPEYRKLMPGVELADSFNFNLHKTFLVNYESSAMWVKNSCDLVKAFTVKREYLAHKNQERVTDLRHWQIPLGRRFRSLKVWIVLRVFGANKIREHLRNLVKMAEHLETLMKEDNRIEIVTPVNCGLLCFRVRGKGDEATKYVLDSLTAAKLIFVVSCRYNNQLVIRVAIGGSFTNETDMEFCWNEIKKYLPNEDKNNIISTNTIKITKAIEGQMSL